MRKLDASIVATGKALPLKKGSIGFLQYAYGEMIAELLQQLYVNLNLSAAFVTATRGCTWTGSSGNPYTIQPGSVFVSGFFSPLVEPYGELFFVDETTITPLIHPILAIQTTQFAPTDGSADPVTFTDGNPYNVHNIRTLALVDGDSTTPGFVCYIDNTNPGGADPCLLTNIQTFVTQNQIVGNAQSSQFVLASKGGGPVTVDVGSGPYNVITSFSPTPLSSNNMLITFTCQAQVNGNEVALGFELLKNGSTLLNSTGCGTITSGNQLDASVTMQAIDTNYNGAHDTYGVIVSSQGGNAGHNSSIQGGSTLVCQCIDAH